MARQVEGPKRALEEVRTAAGGTPPPALQEDAAAWPPEHVQKLLVWVEVWQQILPRWPTYFAAAVD
jgi:hypothetical protein